MGFFKRNPPKPTIEQSWSPAQPKPGGERTLYRVEGIWDEDGNLLRPARMEIHMDDGRSVHHPGDTIELSRLDAAVVSKRHLIVPVFD